MDEVFDKIISNAKNFSISELNSFIKYVKEIYSFSRFTSMRYANEVPGDWGEKELLDALENIRQSKLKSSDNKSSDNLT